MASANIGTLTGSSVAGSLTGENTANTWTITGANSGTLNDSTTTLIWSGFSSLTGGTSTDAFVLSGGTLSGSINGGGGSDTLTGDNVTNSWTITGANTGTVTGIGGTFSNIQNLVGGTGNDTFTFSDGATLSGTLNGGSAARISWICRPIRLEWTWR